MFRKSENFSKKLPVSTDLYQTRLGMQMGACDLRPANIFGHPIRAIVSPIWIHTERQLTERPS